MRELRQTIWLIISSLVSLIIIEIGGIITLELKDKPIIGVLIILLGFLLIYFSFYSAQIKINKDEIDLIKKKMRELEKQKEIDEKLINKIRDIVILGKWIKMEE